MTDRRVGARRPLHRLVFGYVDAGPKRRVQPKRWQNVGRTTPTELPTSARSATSCLRFLRSSSLRQAPAVDPRIKNRPTLVTPPCLAARTGQPMNLSTENLMKVARSLSAQPGASVTALLARLPRDVPLVLASTALFYARHPRRRAPRAADAPPESITRRDPAHADAQRSVPGSHSAAGARATQGRSSAPSDPDGRSTTASHAAR